MPDITSVTHDHTITTDYDGNTTRVGTVTTADWQDDECIYVMARSGLQWTAGIPFSWDVITWSYWFKCVRCNRSGDHFLQSQDAFNDARDHINYCEGE
jgi:hypothetical protein